MAFLHVDEVMLREPSLLVPRQHPIGAVKPDYNHPALAEKYKPTCLAVQNGLGKFINILNNDIATNTGAPTKKGYFISYDGTDDYTDVECLHAYNGSERTGCTILLIQKGGNGIGLADRIVRVGGNGTGIALWGDVGGVVWMFDSQVATGGGSTGRNSSITFGSSEEVWVITSTGNGADSPTTGLVPWKNGKKLAFNATQTFPNDTGGTATSIRLCARLNGSSPVPIDLACVFVWYQKLPDELVQSLSLDPYQIVIPA